VSRRDYIHYKKYLSEFRLKHIQYIAATNSLKIQVRGRTGRGKPYIWIDPSWSLFKNNLRILSSYDYPNHTEGLYLLKHNTWCKKLRILQGKQLMSVSLTPFKSTVFKFSSGFELYSYSGELEEGEYDFDDWYADNIT